MAEEVNHGHDPFYDRLAARLRAARRKANWTIDQLASETGLTPAVVGRLERNDMIRYRFDHIRRISRVLGVSMASLMDDERELGAIIPPGEEPWAWRVTDKREQKLLVNYRELRRWEKRVVELLLSNMKTVRDQRYEFLAKKRKNHIVGIVPT